MPTLTPLKRLIFEVDATQRELADALGIHETSFSSIVNGRLIPSEDRKRLIACEMGRMLGRDVPVSELWADELAREAA